LAGPPINSIDILLFYAHRARISLPACLLLPVAIYTRPSRFAAYTYIYSVYYKLYSNIIIFYIYCIMYTHRRPVGCCRRPAINVIRIVRFGCTGPDHDGPINHKRLTISRAGARAYFAHLYTYYILYMLLVYQYIVIIIIIIMCVCAWRCAHYILL